MIEVAGNALRQAFMTKEDYELLRNEEKVRNRLGRPLVMVGVSILWTAVVVAAVIMVDIVFSVTDHERPFCQKRRMESFNINFSSPKAGDSKEYYALTEEEAAQYFWIFVFLPTSVIFAANMIYLFAGIAVAYSAPNRHSCLKVVENNCCASHRGGVRCLSIINISFLLVFILLAVFLGSSILTLGTDCSIVLFWCYEVICWGIVVLLGGSAFCLHRKAAVTMDIGETYGHRSKGVELLEATLMEEPLYILEQRLSEGFKTWSGATDSDEERGANLGTGLDDVWEEDELGEAHRTSEGTN